MDNWLKDVKTYVERWINGNIDLDSEDTMRVETENYEIEIGLNYNYPSLLPVITVKYSDPVAIWGLCTNVDALVTDLCTGILFEYSNIKMVIEIEEANSLFRVHFNNYTRQ